MSEALADALGEIIDERLKEHGLLAGKGKKKKVAADDDDDADDDDGPTFEQMVAKGKKLVNGGKKAKFIALLKKYKIKQVKDLPETKYAKFDAELDTLAGKKKAAADDDDDDGDMFGDDDE